MCCSSLNEHLFARNLVDSPNCICGSTESTTHFLLHCRRYTDLRNNTILAINYPINFDTNLLLYGSDVLTDDQNKQVFLQVQKYILNSKRFTY